MYADDLILIAVSIHDMETMLEVCRLELLWLDMNLNLSKSSAIRIGDRWDAPISPLTVGGKKVPWAKDIKYLGVVIVALRVFSVDLHGAKVRYFQSLNAILGKIGDCSQISLILSLTATNCVPILFYGLEACLPTAAQLQSLDFAYKAIFCKVFKTFDKNVVLQCQYYTGILPSVFALDLMRLHFLANVRLKPDSPAGF